MLIIEDFTLEYSRKPTSNQTHLNYAVNELYAYIMQQKGKVDNTYWLMYFDALRFIGDHDAQQKFEKAAGSYMKVKDTIPPKWEDVAEDSTVSLTTNIMRIAELDRVTHAKIEDFIQTVKNGSKVSRVDFSIAEFDVNKDYSAVLDWYIELFTQIQGQACSILGATNLLGFLQEKRLEPNSQRYAELLLAVLQCLGEKDQYMKLTDWYIDTYEIVAREYKASNVLVQPDEETTEITNEFALRKNMEVSDVVMLSEFLRTKISNGDNLIEIDGAECQHIEYNALQDLVKIFIENKDLLVSKTVVLKNLRQIVKFSLEAMGLDKGLVSLKLTRYY